MDKYHQKLVKKLKEVENLARNIFGEESLNCKDYWKTEGIKPKWKYFLKKMIYSNCSYEDFLNRYARDRKHNKTEK